MVTEVKAYAYRQTREEGKQFPLVLKADTLEDYATAVALTLRQGRGVSWLPILLPRTSRLPKLEVEMESLHAHVGANDLIETQAWSAFQKLWLRWQAPLDYVEPMRWYLTAAWPAPGLPTQHTETIDQFMQMLATLPCHLRLQHISAALGLSKTDGAVVGWGESEWALPTMLHASLTAKPFLWCKSKDELSEIAANYAGKLTVCVPLHQLDLTLLNRLTDSQSFHLNHLDVQHIPFAARTVSFFTARTLEILTRLPAKHSLYRQHSLSQSAWILTGETVEQRVDPDVTLLTKKDASVERLRLLDKQDVLVLWGHSREDLFHLGSDALCGISNEAPLKTSAGPLPACVHDGHCVKSGARLPVTHLPTRILLLAGCNLMRLGGQGSFAPEYTLAFSSLEGTCNLVVASRRTRFGNPWEQILLYQLLRGGMTVSEAVRVVNNSLPFSGPESPDYLVLGEGDWTPFAASANRARTTISAQEDGWRVECEDVDAQYIEIPLPDFPREIYLRWLETSIDCADLFYAVAPEPDGSCRLFLFGWRRLQADQITLEIGSKPPFHQQQQALSSAYLNQVYYRLFRSYLPKFKNWEQELRSLSTALARHLTEAKAMPIAYQRAEVKAAEAEALLSRVDSALCSFLLERIATGAFVWLEQYMEVDGCFRVAEHLPTDLRCPYCAGLVLRKVIRHRFDQQVARDFAICQTCGNIWDIPLDGIKPRFSGSAFLKRKGEHISTVILKNTLARRVRGWLGFRIYQAQKYGVHIDPPLQEVTLEVGEEREIPFAIHVGERIPAHMEFARGFWVSDLHVSVFQQNIWVTPDDTANP